MSKKLKKKNPPPPKKIKPKKKKIISPTEKKLRGKRNYQISKRKKAYHKLKLGIEAVENSFSKKKGKNTLYDIPEVVKQHLGIKKQDYKATKQTILNAYYKTIYKISNEVDFYENKLIKRFKFKQSNPQLTRQRGQKQINLGMVWEIDAALKNGIFLNEDVASVNGYTKKKQANEILNAVNYLKLRMSSQVFMALIGDKKGNYILTLQNAEDDDDR